MYSFDRRKPGFLHDGRSNGRINGRSNGRVLLGHNSTKETVAEPSTPVRSNFRGSMPTKFVPLPYLQRGSRIITVTCKLPRSIGEVLSEVVRILEEMRKRQR